MESTSTGLFAHEDSGTSLGVLLCGLVATHLYFADQPPPWLRRAAPGIPALILAVMSLSAAQALRLARFAAYAAAFTVAGLAVIALDADPGWAIAAGGLVAAVSGAVQLGRFVRGFPVLPAEMDP